MKKLCLGDVLTWGMADLQWWGKMWRIRLRFCGWGGLKWHFYRKRSFYKNFLIAARGLSLELAELIMMPSAFFCCSEGVSRCSEWPLSSGFLMSLVAERKVLAAASGCWLPPSFNFFFFNEATSLQWVASAFATHCWTYVNSGLLPRSRCSEYLLPLIIGGVSMQRNSTCCSGCLLPSACCDFS